MVIFCAGFAGGFLNAIAGGGSFFTLPALIYIGVGPVSANATGTAALLPGYLASAWRFRRDIDYPHGLGPVPVAVIAIAGGAIGAAILLSTSDRLFAVLVPWLVLFATAAFVVGPKLVRPQARTDGAAKSLPALPLVRIALLFAVCVYGGYFNGGLGIILLAALAILGQQNLHGMNGLKNIVSALLTLVAVAVYAVGDTLAVNYLLPLGAASIAGGYTGAALAYRVPQSLLRGFIVLVGCLLSLIFFLRGAG